MAVELRIEDGLAILSLNRPEKLNAITWEMWEQLDRHIATVDRDPAIRALLLRGEGRGFCSGADVSGSGVSGVAGIRQRLSAIQQVVLRLYSLNKPVVAAVRGPTVGIGWSLTLACDLVVASRTTRFSQIFLNRGGTPDGGAIYLLARQIGEFRAKQMVMSRRFVEADEALALGLVSAVVDDEALEQEASRQAKDLATGPTFGFALAKEMFRCNAASLEDFLKLELSCGVLASQSQDAAEGGTAFREKRAPQFKGR